MILFLNGRFVPEDQAVVSVLDRGFLYGDGLFESIRFLNGRPFLWDQHVRRLEEGARFLQLRLPFSTAALREAAEELSRRNQMSDGLLRLTVSRGVGVRGYSPKQAEHPTVAMSFHVVPAFESGRPEQWRLITSTFRLPAHEALAQFKTCNKLPQILARAQADAANANEALLLNTDGDVVEGASTNLFWIERGTLCTPPLVSGILAGVTRDVLIELSAGLGIPVRESRIGREGLGAAEAVLLSGSLMGVAGAVSLDGQALAQSPIVARLHASFWDFARAGRSAG